MPYLGARTTNIHTALSVSFLTDLIKAIGKPDDEQLLYFAVILHDCGWSMVPQSEIADSHDYKGISFTPIAAHAQMKHTIYGAALAFRLPTCRNELGQYVLICGFEIGHAIARAIKILPRARQ